MLTTIAFLFVLGVLVFVHEFGHFLFAKLFKVRVETFSLGFGKKIWKYQKGETEYCISAFPLGGYVKLTGEQPGEETQKDSRSMSEKPVAQRAAIIFAGPLFNYLTAFLLFSLIFFVGMPTTTTKIGTVKSGYPAIKAGLQKGDTITAVNGKKIQYWSELSALIQKKTSGREVTLSIERNGKQLKKVLIPKVEKVPDLFGRQIKIGIIGVEAGGQTRILRYGFLKSIGKGANQVVTLTRVTYFAFYRIILGKMSFRKAFGGPVLIYQATGEAAKEGFIYLLNLMAALSVSLAIINLLPLPIIDGGHLLFLLIEKLKGSPVSLKTLEAANRIGMALILALTVFVFYNDLTRIGFFTKIMKLFSGN